MSDLPRAILFDLDDTLIWFGSRKQLAIDVAAEFEEFICPLTPAEVGEVVEQANRDFWAEEGWNPEWRFRLLEARTLIVELAFASLCSRAPGLTSTVARSYAERFQMLRDVPGGLFPNAVETLDILRSKGILLALITNGEAKIQREKVIRFDLERRFDHIQIEGEIGFGKPSDQAYHHPMNVLGVSPHEAWMVGDNLEWEVAAPQRLGIYSIWNDHLGEGLPPDTKVKPDRIIRSVAELAS